MGTTKLKCLQGSHSFNGSCYFISNKKYIDAETEKDLIIENILRLYKNKKKISSSIQSTPIGTAAELATLPVESNWKNAFNFCSQLNNDSTLLEFTGNIQEYNYIIELIRKLNFQDSVATADDKGDFRQEQKYFIGLTYNSILNLYFFRIVENHFKFEEV